MMKPRKIGYVRQSKSGLSRDEQERLVRTMIGKDEPVWVEPMKAGRTRPGVNVLKERGIAITSLGAGDELVVSDASRLGVSAVDVLATLVEIGKRGASVYDMSADKHIHCTDETGEALEFALRAESILRRATAAKARAVRAASGLIGGRPALPASRIGDAEALWRDLSLSASQVAEKTGISERTLHRRFGARGIGAGRPAKKQSI